MISCYERLARILDVTDEAGELTDPEFEWLIEGESSVLQLLARLAFYAGCQPTLDEADAPLAEQTRIYQTVSVFRSSRGAGRAAATS